MNWKLPNQLTLSRLVLSMVFFVLLATSGAHSNEFPNPDRLWLLTCFIIYIVAGITDVLDGYLARKWNLTTVFGRIADPFADKVIVCGAFALLAGANFAFLGGQPVDAFERSLPHWLHGGMASGVQAWMVVVLVAREFIISGIRGYSESQGLKFPATPAGKIKMFIQSLTICTVLLQMAYFQKVPWAIVMKTSLVWLTIIATVLSSLAYVSKARVVLRGDEHA